MAQLTEIVLDPGSGEMGPCMRALLPQQRAFVDAYLTQGVTNFAQSARSAGYAPGPDNCARTGHRLAHDEKVLLAIEEESKRRLKAHGGMAVKNLVLIAEDESLGAAHRLRAIEMILNRSGMPAVAQVNHEHQHTVTLTPERRRIRLAQLEKELKKLPGATQPAGVIDASFTEVVVTGREGLEDLL